MIYENPVLEKLGRRIRLGIIGGAPGSFIGGVHRMAARLDDCYDIVCGVMSSSPQKARETGRAMGFADGRLYGTVEEMLSSETALREDGGKAIDAVAIMTPNHMHFPYSMAALDAGFHVICDKPMTNSLDEARQLHQKVVDSGLVFCLTHNYTGYPLVRQAREMIADGQLGDLRLIQVEYVQGGRAVNKPVSPDMPRAWKFDPEKSGPSLVMGDIGTHAHNLLRFVTGMEVGQLSARLGTIVPERQVHDFAGIQFTLENGAAGVMWVTQAAAGIENSLRFRISGSLGTLEWFQEIPQRMTFYPVDGSARVLTPNGPEIMPAARRASRIVKGHPEGYTSAFAVIYREAAEAMAGSMSGSELLFPDSADGLRGLEFVQASIDSSSRDGAWIHLKEYQV
jgi:predicted dehydrogenase